MALVPQNDIAGGKSVIFTDDFLMLFIGSHISLKLISWAFRFLIQAKL